MFSSVVLASERAQTPGTGERFRSAGLPNTSGVRVGTKERRPRNFGYNSDFTAVFNVIF